LGLIFLFANPPATIAAELHPASRQVETMAAVRPTVASDHAHSNGVSNGSCPANGTASPRADDAFGMFHGMTLEQAIRSAEQRS